MYRLRREGREAEGDRQKCATQDGSQRSSRIFHIKALLGARGPNARSGSAATVLPAIGSASTAPAMSSAASASPVVEGASENNVQPVAADHSD